VVSLLLIFWPLKEKGVRGGCVPEPPPVTMATFPFTSMLKDVLEGGSNLNACKCLLQGAILYAPPLHSTQTPAVVRRSVPDCGERGTACLSTAVQYHQLKSESQKNFRVKRISKRSSFVSVNILLYAKTHALDLPYHLLSCGAPAANSQTKFCIEVDRRFYQKIRNIREGRY
jgi:hypothetical protein